jgi:redox-sensitive bicupin YhaK (pirin superfamily)
MGSNVVSGSALAVVLQTGNNTYFGSMAKTLENKTKIVRRDWKIMKTVIHKADSRGYANHGWLQTHHTFSFARYYDPTRVHFGELRVLNDDVVAGGEGFGTHPHDNMEIVSIPLEGSLSHRDSMGNGYVINTGEIQVMSAGTGITHSEFSGSETEPVKFLQIWVFPDREGYTPRYENLVLAPARTNELRTLVTPEDKREEGASWMHQQAWFHTIDLENHSYEYEIRRPGKNGLYVFVLEGGATVGGEELSRRDGMGVWDTDKVTLSTRGAARLLLIDVPMVVS